MKVYDLREMRYKIFFPGFMEASYWIWIIPSDNVKRLIKGNIKDMVEINLRFFERGVKSRWHYEGL